MHTFECLLTFTESLAYAKVPFSLFTFLVVRIRLCAKANAVYSQSGESSCIVLAFREQSTLLTVSASVHAVKWAGKHLTHYGSFPQLSPVFTLAETSVSAFCSFKGVDVWGRDQDCAWLALRSTSGRPAWPLWGYKWHWIPSDNEPWTPRSQSQVSPQQWLAMGAAG